MAELKKFEYIIEFEPYYMENKIGELCFKSKKVTQLVRCRDCYYADYSGMGNGTVWCMEIERAMQETDFCSRGKIEGS